MKILALELSSERRSVAVVVGTRLAGLAASGSPTRHATQAFALIESALREAGVSREEVECIAVGTGPGSYTGIRVAIAAAQGWQLVRDVRLLGVSSIEGLAAQVREEGWRGPAHVVINAERNEAYLAGYDITDGGCRETAALRLAPLAEVKALAAAGQAIFGPDLEEWGVQGRTVWPAAKQIGLLAAGRTDFVHGEELAPIYLRVAAYVKAPPSRKV
jgi:tRNA threonylcarbamoyl adenosine modification protein YeaZ